MGQCGTISSPSAWSFSSFPSVFWTKLKGGNAYITAPLLQFTVSACTAALSGSGLHDMKGWIWQFSLDANKSTSGQTTFSASCMKMFGSNFHSVWSWDFCERFSASLFNMGCAILLAWTKGRRPRTVTTFSVFLVVFVFCSCCGFTSESSGFSLFLIKKYIYNKKI